MNRKYSYQWKQFKSKECLWMQSRKFKIIILLTDPDYKVTFHQCFLFETHCLCFARTLFLSGGCEADYSRMLNVPGEQVRIYFDTNVETFELWLLGDLPWWPPLGRCNKVHKSLDLKQGSPLQRCVQLHVLHELRWVVQFVLSCVSCVSYMSYFSQVTKAVVFCRWGC